MIKYACWKKITFRIFSRYFFECYFFLHPVSCISLGTCQSSTLSMFTNHCYFSFLFFNPFTHSLSWLSNSIPRLWGLRRCWHFFDITILQNWCFDVPVIHLFDLVVGTSVGGLIGLALTVGKPPGPLTVVAANDEFPDLIHSVFDTKFALAPSASMLFSKTMYKMTLLESCLKEFFGEKTKLYSASLSSPWNVPNVSMTTTLLPSEAHLITN